MFMHLSIFAKQILWVQLNETPDYIYYSTRVVPHVHCVKVRALFEENKVH